MIDIRRLYEEEIEEAKALVPDRHCEPNWNLCWGVIEDGELVGVIGFEHRIVAEPQYMKKGHARAAHTAMAWLDGYIRPVAASHGINEYSFFINDTHPEFQKFVRDNWPVHEWREEPGARFTRRF